MANPMIYVDSPERAPREGGIKSIAAFVENSRLSLGSDNLQYTSLGCAFPVDDVVLCFPGGTQNVKNPAGIDKSQTPIANFGLYAGVECWLDGDDYNALAERALEQGEDRGVENRLNTWLQTVAATGSAAGNLTEAIARAEQYADNSYLGRPNILINRGDATRWKGAFSGDGSDLHTVNGTPVMASGKITAGTIGIIGGITVFRSPVITSRSPNPTLNQGGATPNTEMAIAERVYSIVIDCNFAARFTV